MALYGMTQRNDAVQSAAPAQSTYGGMFARNDAPQASAPQATSASPGMSETGYGRYGSRPRQDGGAWQGSRPGGTTGAIGGIRGGWGGAGGGWGQPAQGQRQTSSAQTGGTALTNAANWANQMNSAPRSGTQSMSPAPISYQTAELQRRAEAGGYPTVGARYGNTQQTYNGQPIDWSLPADKIPPPNAQQLAEWERQSAIDTQRNVPANFQQQYAQMQARSDANAARNQYTPTSNTQQPYTGYTFAGKQFTDYGGGSMENAGEFARKVMELNPGTSSPSVVPGVKSGPDEYGGAPAQTPSVQFNTPQQRMGVTGWGQGSAAQGAYAAPPSMPTPSVIPGIKSGPDEFGGAPAQTPSVQFNTPWQRLGIDGYGAGNAAQGAFSEQTGQVGAPSPLMPARTMPTFAGTPFVGPTYGQPMPSAPGVGAGTYGPGAVPTGMSSRYARQPVTRTLY